MHQKTPEDTKRHGTKVEDQQLLGVAGWPHHHATRPPLVGFFHALLEYSSIVS
jgi:hypothetical protein